MKAASLKNFEWINQPKKFVVDHNRLLIETEPGTDLWQRTYYGFRYDNAPSFLSKMEGDFTFAVKTEFEEASLMYDQCGVLVYYNSENWIKISVEVDNEQFSRLGSVVTNLGYSDWATTDVPSDISEMWYRVNRRGSDYYIESSFDGILYRQMRMLHMHHNSAGVKIGVYACSPMTSGFNAVFSEFKIGPCLWPAYKDHD